VFAASPANEKATAVTAAFSPDSHLLLSLATDGVLRHWEIPDGTVSDKP
jgi:hypothetical protein